MNSSNENSNELGSFLAGFVIGGLVGAAVALVLAPQSGAQTRQQIVEKGNALGGETATTYLAEARARAQTAGSQAQERFSIVLDEGKAKLAEAKERMSQVTNRPTATGDEAPHEDAETA